MSRTVMFTRDEVQTAINRAITKWKVTESSGTGPSGSCPLCDLFFSSYCVGCPICTKTKLPLCMSTPYFDFIRGRTIKAKKIAACNEVRFLSGLEATDVHYPSLLMVVVNSIAAIIITVYVSLVRSNRDDMYDI